MADIKYIYQRRMINKRIEKLTEESERWRARAEKATTTLTGLPPGSDGENKRELAICKMVECEEEITNLRNQLKV